MPVVYVVAGLATSVLLTRLTKSVLPLWIVSVALLANIVSLVGYANAHLWFKLISVLYSYKIVHCINYSTYMLKRTQSQPLLVDLSEFSRRDLQVIVANAR
jgi:hypothetical protein